MATPVLAAVVLGLFSVSASASTFLGANIDSTWRYPPAAQNVLLSSLSVAGFGTARFDVNWAAAEPRRGVFDWSTLDQEMATIAAAHLQPFPILDKSPPWDRLRLTNPAPRRVLPDQIAPSSPGPFATFAAAFARRYGVHGSYFTAQIDPVHSYEIWNEENESLSFYPTNAPRYATLYGQTRSALRRIDPHATVMFGGLAALWHSDSTGFNVAAFTRAALRALGRSCPDSIGYHAYPLTVAGTLAALQNFRSLIDRAGCKRTPIELNEYDYVGRGNSASAVATTARRVMSASLRVDRLMLYPAVPPPDNPLASGYPTLVATSGVLTAVGTALSRVAPR
jgi:hypothetical protein